MEEVQAAIEIVKMPLEVGGKTIEISSRVISNSVETMINMVRFFGLLKEQLRKNYLAGELNLDKLLEKTQGDIQVFQFDEEKMEEVKAAFDKWGVTYAEAPELNENDQCREIFYATNAAPRVALLAEKLQAAGISCKTLTPDEYIKNADEEHKEELDSLVEKLTGKVNINDMNPEQQEFAERLEYNELLNDHSKQLFTINRKLVVEQDESKDYIVTRIPKTEQFIQFPKKMVYMKDNESTYCCFVDKNTELSVMDKKGNVIQTLSAGELYRRHYDSSRKRKQQKNKNVSEKIKLETI